MGGSESKEQKMPTPPPVKEGGIKIDSTNLSKIKLVNLGVAKPPPIKTAGDLKRDKEQELLKDLINFDLDKEFNQETFTGRF